MAISLVGHVGKVAATSTTVGFNSTGATLLVIIAHYYYVPASYTFSDTYGNTWHQLSVYGHAGDAVAVMAYSYDKAGAALSLGANHYFTIASDGIYNFQGLTVSAWKGTLANHVDPFYAENGGTFGASPRQPGNLAAYAAGDLFISGCSEGNSKAYGPSINGSWVITDSIYDGADMGGGHAYLLAPDTNSVNPTWTYTGSTQLCANIATFKAASGGASAEFVEHNHIKLIFH